MLHFLHETLPVRNRERLHSLRIDWLTGVNECYGVFATVRLLMMLPSALGTATEPPKRALKVTFITRKRKETARYCGEDYQILSPRPFLIFGPFKDQIERLSVDGPETYAVRVAVQNHRFQQLSAFCVVPRKIKKMRSVSQFENPLHC